MKILVIADSHISPTVPNIEDWEALGHYVVKTRPDCIVHLGDVADLDSLAWRKDARGLYSTKEEIDNVWQHLQAFEEILKIFQNKCRKQKEKIYRPLKFLCCGNHDVRNGFTGIMEMFESCGWSVLDYLDPLTIDGISFCHTMMKGLTDTPCTTAEDILENWHSNIVVGHSHKLDYAESYSLATNDRIRALKCPIFNSTTPHWAHQGQLKWATGFTEITTKPFQFVWRDMSCLHKTY